MKNLLKITTLVCLYGIYKVFSIFRQEKLSIVLMYHSVSASGGDFSLALEKFEKQIDYLHKNKYKFLTTQNLFDIVSDKHYMIKKGVLLTFDDGYHDFMTIVVPVLDKYKASAVLFVHTNRSPEPLKNNLTLLSNEEIKSLSVDFEIGSHSHSHPNLKGLSIYELEKEIQESQRIIQELISKKMEIFAYPFGRFNQQVIEVLKRHNYRLGFTIDMGMVRVGDDPFRIKRFGINRDTPFTEFKTRITSAGEWYEKLANLFRDKSKKKYL